MGRLADDVAVDGELQSYFEQFYEDEMRIV